MGEYRGDMMDVEDDHDKGEQHIDDGHHRNDLARHVADAPHAADQHRADQQKQQQRAHPGGYGKIGGKRLPDGIALHHRARTDAGHDAEEGEAGTEPHPFGAEAVLDEIHGPAYPVPGGRPLTEMHREEHFAELGGHAHKGRHPHPEQRARSPDVNGRGHAHDVSGPDVRGKRGHERVEGGNLAPGGLILTAFPQVFEPAREIAEGEEAQPDGKIEPCSHQQDQHTRPPYHIVDLRQPLHKRLHCSP